MRAPIYKNKEFLRLLITVSAIVLVIAALLLAGSHYAWSIANADITQRNLGLLGHLLQANPELSSEEAGRVVEAFTREASPADLEAGKELAAKYGYTEGLSMSSSPILGKWRDWLLTGVGLLSVVALVSLVGAVYIYSDRTYRRLSEYNLGAERIMRGDYSIHFPDSGEGELAMLGFQFNQLSRRLQMSFAALQDEKQQMKDMVSGISHQLKTPLASSKVFVELLLEGAGDDPEILQEFLNKNLSQLERMEWLIHSLLKLSRLESGAVEFKKTNENLTVTLEEVFSALSDKAEEKKQELSFHSCTFAVMAPHDQQWLAEALTNIIDNAIRYTPEGGMISVVLDQTDSTAVVRVKDTGPGIPAGELSRIFQRFYQGSNRSGGSGIGLALAKLIVEKHGGIIEAASTLGNGTIFTVTLPRVWLS